MKNKPPEQNQNLPVEGKKSKSTSKPPAAPASGQEDQTDALQLAFLSTDLMQAKFALDDALAAAIAAGKDRAELPLEFLKAIQFDISATPFRFDAVTEEWNRVCDVEGRPDQKKNPPGPEEPGGTEDENGPF
jgi:hypothetical protein